ncbi:hypothetical protein IID20_04120 [Patescibacteria group bacterium]|nr:hypothetical protein [Patescibacteria group bacterium]
MILKNKKVYFVLFFGLMMISYLLLANIVLAGEHISTLDDPLGGRDIPELAGDIIGYILGLVGVLALVMFIYGGILWMTSAGSAEKIKKGKDTIVWAVLGLALIFFSYAMVEFILKALLNQ